MGSGRRPPFRDSGNGEGESPSIPSSTVCTTTTPPTALSFSFSTALFQIQSSSSLLSTSPGVIFPAPSLIVGLSEKERTDPQRRLKGDEKVGLGSLLGWEGCERLHWNEGEAKTSSSSRGRGMMGLQGFLRHQAFSVLISEHVAHPAPVVSGEKEPSGGSAGGSSYVHTQKPYLFSVCGRPRVKTLRYYRTSGEPGRRGGSGEKDVGVRDRIVGGDKETDKAGEKDVDGDNEPEDVILGEAIRDWVEDADKMCVRPGCTVKRGEHEVRYVHGGVRVAVNVKESERGQDDADVAGEGEGEAGAKSGNGGKQDRIMMWESCVMCGERTKKRVMSDGT
jgi:1-phosphatidylinositol-3-phosphate 5-kinase